MEQIEVRVSDITLTNVGFAVFLKPKDPNENKVLPIFIGPLETHSITTVVDKVIPPRPLTHDLMMMILPILGAKIVNITIDEIKDNTFYAKISIRRDEEIFVVDARPSDSIAIALRAEAPIFITRNILDEAGVIMKDGEIPSDSTDEFEQPAEITNPKSPLEILQSSLEESIKAEDYETAARIRDQIKKMIENS
jgi:uncharacterized protein